MKIWLEWLLTNKGCVFYPEDMKHQTSAFDNSECVSQLKKYVNDDVFLKSDVHKITFLIRKKIILV